MNQDIKLVIDELNQIEDADYIVIYSAVTLLETLGNKVAEQAAVIEKLIPALRFDSLNMSLAEWRDVCKVAKVARADSKQILADWMREQMGEPINMVIHYDEAGLEHGIHLTQPLFKLPECLK